MIELFYPPTPRKIEFHFAAYPQTIRTHGANETDEHDDAPQIVDGDSVRQHNASQRRVALIIFLRSYAKFGPMTPAQIRYHGGINNSFDTTNADLRYLAKNKRIGRKGDLYWAI